MLLNLQNNYNKTISDEVFGNMSEHLYDKWLDSDDNILCYLTRLDTHNKLKLLKWTEDNYIKISGKSYE
jgi:hypothetical protein